MPRDLRFLLVCLLALVWPVADLARRLRRGLNIH